MIYLPTFQEIYVPISLFDVIFLKSKNSSCNLKKIRVSCKCNKKGRHTRQSVEKVKKYEIRNK